MSIPDRTQRPAAPLSTVRRPRPRHVRELLDDYLSTFTPADAPSRREV